MTGKSGRLEAFCWGILVGDQTVSAIIEPLEVSLRARLGHLAGNQVLNAVIGAVALSEGSKPTLLRHAPF